MTDYTDSLDLTQPGPVVVRGMPFDAYLKIEAVNSTLLKAFLRSHEHGDWEAKNRRETTDSLILGGAMHTMILEGREVFNARYSPGGPINPKTGECYGRATKAYTEWAEANGIDTGMILSEKEIADIEGMCESIKAQPDVLGTIKAANATREIVVVWDEPWGETTVRCKARLDYCHPELGVIDVKTCQDCRAEAFARDITKFGYDLQAAFYAQASHAAGLNPHKDFGWIAIEKKPPYLIGLWTPTDNMLDTGAANMRLAMARYLAWEDAGRECVREPVTFRPIDLPPWAKGNPIDSLKNTHNHEEEQDDDRDSNPF